MSNATLKQQSNYLKAMGNFYRLQILTLLLNGEKKVSDINKHVKVSQPALSQHLSKMRRFGILGARREQRSIYYFINNSQIVRIMGILETKTE